MDGGVGGLEEERGGDEHFAVQSDLLNCFSSGPGVSLETVDFCQTGLFLLLEGDQNLEKPPLPSSPTPGTPS